MANQSIHCNVHSCRHNDHQHKCTLSDITVGNTAPVAHNCAETECDSFEA